MKQGQESFVYLAARQNDPVIQAQVERIKNDPNVMHENTLSLVKALTKPGAFALVNTGEVEQILFIFQWMQLYNAFLCKMS